MLPVARPRPEADALSRPFWDAARDGRLVLQRCARCDAAVFPPSSHCPRCRRATLRWVPHAMAGTVRSWSRTHTTVVQGIEAPYTTVSVEVDDAGGTRLLGFLATPEVRIGDRVRLAFPLVDGVPTATFTPDDARPAPT